MKSPPSCIARADLYLFVSSRFISTVAIQVQSVAIGWQIYDMEKTPLALGLVGLCQFLPMFLLTLPAGDVTDRFNQRRVYSLAAGCRPLCSVLFLSLSVLRPHTAWMFYAVLVLFGAARGFAGPSGQSLLPFLVPQDKLPRSISVNSSAFTGAIIAGPALGGFLYAFGPVAVYSICIIGFALAALIVARLGGRRFTPEATLATRFERVAEGVRFVKSRPVVLGAISLDLFAVLLGGATALLPIYARDILHVGPTGLGLLRSAPRRRGLSDGRLAHPPPDQEPCRRQDVRRGGDIRAGHHPVPAFRPWFLCRWRRWFVLGAADMVSVNIRSSLIQLSTPDTMRGRVSAVSMLFIGASNELGEFESGTTAALMGTVRAVVAGGIGTLLVVGGWMKLFPPLRRVNSFHLDVAV